MSVKFKSLSPAIGAIVEGISSPDCAREDAEALYQGFLDYGLLLFPDISLTPVQHVSFSHLFGATECHPIESIRHAQCPELIVLTANSAEQIPDGDPRGDEVVGQIPWHTDLTYTKTPSLGALLAAVQVPDEGGLTGWIDTAAVYDALPEQMKQRISGLRVEHDFANNQAATRRSVKESDEPPQTPRFPPVVHPLVDVHPETGRKILNVSPLFAARILDVPEAEGAELLKELQNFATQAHFAYVHDWQVGDLMLWDNRRTMHRAFGYPRKYQRVMHRSTLQARST